MRINHKLQFCITLLMVLCILVTQDYYNPVFAESGNGDKTAEIQQQKEEKEEIRVVEETPNITCAATLTPDNVKLTDAPNPTKKDVSWLKTNLTSDMYSTIEWEGDTLKSISVQNANALILIANTDPAVYQDADIVFAASFGLSAIALNGSVKDTKGTSYSMCPMGSQEYPFCGSFEATSVIRIPCALFAWVEDATLSKLTITRTANYVNSALLCEHYKGSDKNYQVTIVSDVTDADTGELLYYTFAGIVGTMEEQSELKINVVNKTNANSVGKTSVGYICNTMNAESTLTVSVTQENQEGYEVLAIGQQAGGYVGEMLDSASLKITGDVETENIVKSVNKSAGGIVGQMAENSSLEITGNLKGQGSVLGKQDVGGVVGTIAAGVEVKIAGNLTIKSDLISSAGNAGGVSATGEDLLFQVTGTILVTDNKIQGIQYVGGLFGEYTYAAEVENCLDTVDITKVHVNQITLMGKATTSAGGLFGLLKNTSNKKTFTIKGDDTVSSVLKSEGGNYGGLMGTYCSTDLKNSLLIKQNEILSEIGCKDSDGLSYVASSYGGVIGEISGDLSTGASYVKVDSVLAHTCQNNVSKTLSYSASDTKVPITNASASYYGGVVGLMSTKGHFLELQDIEVNSENKFRGKLAAGGLVGSSDCGVISLKGVMNLAEAKPFSCNRAIDQTYTYPEVYYGQLVAKHNNTFVYAMGDGEHEETFQYLRYKRSVNNKTLQTLSDALGVADLGDWGSLIRITDTNGLSDLITKNETAHTVTLSDFHMVGSKFELDSKSAFCSLAMYIQLSANGATGYDSLQFAKDVNVEELLGADIIMTTDLDFSGTGLTGLVRDDGSQAFFGSFDGTNHSITLPIGEQFAIEKSKDNITPVHEYSYGNGQNYNHSYMGFIPKINSKLRSDSEPVYIENVTVIGDCEFAVMDQAQCIYIGGIAGDVDGDIYFENVTSDMNFKYGDLPNFENNNSKVSTAYCGGMIGRMSGNNKATFKRCGWGGSSMMATRCSTIYLGGYVALFDNDSSGRKGNGGANTIVVEDCTVSGTLTQELGNYTNGIVDTVLISNQVTNAKYPRMAGLIGQMGSVSATSTMKVKGLTVDDTHINCCLNGNTSSGAGSLVGYAWLNTDVEFDGVVVKNSSIEAKAKGSSDYACAGGLVFQASGKWDIKGDGISFVKDKVANNIKCGSYGNSSPAFNSGLLVAIGYSTTLTTGINVTMANNNKALYMEVEKDAYHIEDGAVEVTLSKNKTNYDDFVGTTMFSNGNGVVSIATGGDRDSTYGYPLLNQGDNDTWQNRCMVNGSKNYSNKYSRYYYNLDTLRLDEGEVRDLSAGVKSGVDLLMWSLYQYSTANIKEYFATKVGGSISGTIDLTGLSYYPASDPISVNGATVIFDAKTIVDKEKTRATELRRYPSNSANQHFLMHSGLFLNISASLSVKNLVLQGTITPFTGTKTDSIIAEKYRVTANGSGAIVCGVLKGTSVSKISDCSLNNVTLDGIGVYSDSTSLPSYCPLLLNRVSNYTTVNVPRGSTIITTEKYTQGGKTAQIASSLIGNVGDTKSATDIHLNFLGTMALDGRKPATGSVKSDVYKTYNSIFKNATFLEAFSYPSAVTSCGGQYIFNKSDICTYGYELSNSEAQGGRNPDRQIWYYDTIGDEEVTDSLTNTSGYDFSAKYLRYVNKKENAASNYFEIDINQRTLNLDEGCGTYGDPFIIREGAQLTALANYLEGTVSDGFVVHINQECLTKHNNSADLHTAAEGSDKDVYYQYHGSEWVVVEKENGEYVETSMVYQDMQNMCNYIRNAYFIIQPNTKEDGTYEITLDKKFHGIGSSSITKNTFCGVIIGAQNANGDLPTVKVPDLSAEQFQQFGGIVNFGQGCVVKDLNIDYTEARIKLTDLNMGTVSQEKAAQHYFGGVLGYAVGGDNIIDHVSVLYGTDSVSTTHAAATSYENNIPIGGYVGLIGANVKAGGGVIFRNLPYDQKGLEFINDLPLDDSADYYWNPFVGRVLDGFCCYDSMNSDIEYASGSAVYLENTNKNYSIPNLREESTMLSVDKWSTGTNVVPTITVNSAQQLWLLSAIVNSGAASQQCSSNNNASANFNYVINEKEGAAYGYGRVRSGFYNEVGTSVGDNGVLLEDDTRWGGITDYNTTAKGVTKSSYLSTWFTDTVDVKLGSTTYTLHGINRVGGTNSQVQLNITEDIDVSEYGNGFRGIGSAYQKYSDSDSSVARKLNLKALNGNNHTITYNCQRKEYDQYDFWHICQMGLFNLFYTTVSASTISDLSIAGTLIYDSPITSQSSTVMAIGGVVGAMQKDVSKAVTFENIQISTENSLDISGATDAGGCVGLIGNYGSQYTFEDCNMNHTSIEGEKTAGVFVGNNGNKPIVFQQVKVNDSELVSKQIASRTEGNGVGGLIGSNSGVFTGADIEIHNLKLTGADMGGVVGANYAAFTAEQIKANGVTLESNSTLKESAGGLIGYSNSTATVSQINVQNLHLMQRETNAETYAGGLFGYSGNKIVLKDAKVLDAKLVSGGMVGGVVGLTKGATTFENVYCRDNIIAATSANNVGGMVGSLMANWSGVNLLSDNNSVGYLLQANSSLDATATQLITGEGQVDWDLLTDLKVGLATTATTYHFYETYKDNPTTAIYNSKQGVWAGAGNGYSVQLVAVSRQGENSAVNEIGGTYNSNSRIIYGDYTGTASTKMGTEDEDELLADEAPYITKLPMKDMPGIGEVYGDGIGTKNGAGIGCAISAGILEQKDYKYKTSYDHSRVAYPEQYEDGSWIFTNKIVNYLALEGNSEYYSGKSKPSDFPVLLVDNATLINEQMNSYIALLTNSASKDYSVKVQSYRYDTAEQKFTTDGVAKNSITYRNDKWYATINQYDNDKGQFTMVYITYANPVNSSKPFVIGIPVLIQKVMPYEFYAANLAGTVYTPKSYQGIESSMLTSHGENFTSLLTFIYNRTQTEWENAIQAGDNLNFSLSNKAAWLGSDELPSQTKFVLVDPSQKGKQAYYGVLGEDLSLAGDNQKLAFSSFSGWEDVYICDLLNPKAEEDESGLFDITTDPSQASIRCWDESKNQYVYYQYKELGGKYRIDIAPDLNEDGYIEQNYFLTVQTPSTATGLVNNIITYEDSRLDTEGKIATQKNNKKINGQYNYCKNSTEYYLTAENRYIISEFFNQNMSVNSENYTDGKLYLDQGNRTLSVELKAKDVITLKNGATFRNYITDATSLFQRLDIQAKQYDEDGSVTSVDLVDGTKYKIQYTVKGSDGTVIAEPIVQGELTEAKKSISHIFEDAGNQNIIDWFRDVSKGGKGYDKVEIEAKIVFTYDEQTLYKQFMSNETLDPDVGLEYSVQSKLANEKAELSATSLSASAHTATRYFREDYRLANLNYYAYEMESMERSGDVSQLGINAFHNDEYQELLLNPAPIYSLGQYDVSTVSSIENAKRMECKLKVLRKLPDGSYDEANPVVAENYISSVQIRGKEVSYDSDSKCFVYNEPLTQEEEETYQSVPLDIDVNFSVLSDDLVASDFAYSNYRVVLSADLQTEEKESLQVEAEDYIIYTNAKINPGIQ